jgi:IclR family pca regulon transcriptional regulator
MRWRPRLAKADRIDGIAKGLAVLESFDTERQRLNATLAAQRAGLTGPPRGATC